MDKSDSNEFCGYLCLVKGDFGYSTTRKLVVEDVVDSGQKMAEEAMFPVK